MTHPRPDEDRPGPTDALAPADESPESWDEPEAPVPEPAADDRAGWAASDDDVDPAQDGWPAETEVPVAAAASTAAVIEPEPAVPPAPRRRTVLAPPAPDADRHVAHVLLRAGNVLPARVHLETLAGRRQLDLPGLLDLAESRWRTGDLGGAGEAVAAYLESGGTAPLAHLIAAEATSAMGRPGEARKLARRALEDLAEPLDAVFAGQSRSGIWPQDPAVQAQPAGTLFAAPASEAARGGRIGLTLDPRPATPPTAPSAPPAASSASATPPEPDAASSAEPPPAAPESQPDRGLWDAEPAAPPGAQGELDAARAALDDGDPRAAAVRLAIVLRVSPALAPLVLDLVGQLPGPDFDLLRGDALRLVGHEAAAERAFAAAADALREQQPPSRSPE